jgi:hypothetical protein
LVLLLVSFCIKWLLRQGLGGIKPLAEPPNPVRKRHNIPFIYKIILELSFSSNVGIYHPHFMQIYPKYFRKTNIPDSIFYFYQIFISGCNPDQSTIINTKPNS